MDAADQIFIFLVCVLVGVASGPLYELCIAAAQGKHDLAFGKGSHAFYPRDGDAFLLFDIQRM